MVRLVLSGSQTADGGLVGGNYGDRSDSGVKKLSMIIAFGL